VKQGIGEMADGFEWYATRDIYRWSIADAASRAGAIAYGRNEFGGESFYICRARTQEHNLEPDFSWLMEHLSENNSENLDGDGDQFILDNPGKVTTAQENELEAALGVVIREWAERNKVEFALPWSFVEIHDQEFILGEKGYDDLAQEHYHALVASMGRAR
jgi:hypothetical protein